MQKEIDNALKQLFPPEHRFMSHLTIARIKYAPEPIKFTNFIKELKVKPLSFKIKEFKLKSSELNPLGPTYKTLKSFSLTTL